LLEHVRDLQEEIMRKNRSNLIVMLTAFATLTVVSGCHKQVASKPAATQPPQPSSAPPIVAPASSPAKTASAESRPSAPAESLEQLFQENIKDAFFDYDKSDLRPEARQALLADAEFLRSHPEIKLTLEGHCDERGSEEYNLGLGDRRATSAKRFLENAGISGARIQTTSYGKERPFCTEHDESCWKENRRAHSVMTP
jgi:peptidoglycan-associated lipoprotein